MKVIVALDRLVQRFPLWLFRALFWMAMLAICWLAVTPVEPAVFEEIWDKWQHLAAFAALALLATLAWPQSRLTQLVERFALFGAMIELVQSIPALHRSCDILDWITDMIGTCVMLGLVALVRQIIAVARPAAPETH
jgi:VanZ family protein